MGFWPGSQIVNIKCGELRNQEILNLYSTVCGLSKPDHYLNTTTGSTGDSWYMFVHVGILYHFSWDSFCIVVTLRILLME